MTDGTDPIETIAGGAGVIFSGRIVKLGLLFLVEIIMARVLGSTAYGSVVLATIVIGVGTRVASLGIPRGFIRMLPYYEDEPAKARSVLQAGIAAAFVGGIAIGGLVFAFAPVLASQLFSDPDLIPLLRIAAVGIPLGVMTSVGLSIARAGRTAKPRVVVNHFVNPISQAALVGILVLIGYGAFGAMAGRVLAKFLAAVIAFYLAYRALRFSLQGSTEPMARELITFSLPLMFATGVDFLISNTDTFLIGTFLASSAVGIYNVAFQLRRAALFFYHPFTFLLSPVFSRIDATTDLHDAHHIYQVITKWIVLLTIPIFLAIFFFPRIAISLSFGSQYFPGATALRVLAIPMMVTVFLGANEKALIALGHNRISLYVNLAVATINIVLNVLLIPRIGIVGAAIASAAAFLVRDIVFTTALYRWENLHPFSKAMVYPFLGGIALALIGYPLVVRIVGVSVISVIAAGLLFLIIYVPLSIRLGALESEDSQLLSLIENRLDREIPYLRRVALTIKEFKL